VPCTTGMAPAGGGRKGRQRMFRTIEREPPHELVTRYFPLREAARKLGRFVRSRCPLSFVKSGTFGRVVNLQQTFNGEYAVVVQWNVPFRYKPPLDWFTRNEYEALLEEV